LNTKRLARCLVLLLLAAGLGRLKALEFRAGLIRLDIHEATGRFSLYCLTDPETEHYEPLFTHQDPRTSFLAVSINNRVHRLGETTLFSIEIENNPSSPAIVFRSPFLLVRQEFLFIRTPGYSEVNGIRMTMRIENLDEKEAAVGTRFLIDTYLGEGLGGTPFETDRQRITTETALTGAAEDMWWVSRNSRLSLMGSIFVGVEKKPDLLHFANWKRLNDMPWKTGHTEGRNFNYPPYSIGDSAVCYYYEPVPLQPKEQASYGIFLAAGDGSGFGFRSSSPSGSSASGQREADVALLHELLARLDQFLAGEIEMSAEDLAGMEQTIAALKSRYNLP
jgi:hypothetical protein